MDKIKNKNPKDDQGKTPLHNAAQYGYLDVCKAIMEKIKDKNPKDDNGRTPLHNAAENGHLEVCHAIIDKLNPKDKYPRDNNGQTPFQLALANDWRFDNGPIAYEDLYLPNKIEKSWQFCTLI